MKTDVADKAASDYREFVNSFRQAPGTPAAEEWHYLLNQLPADKQAAAGNRLAYCRWTDRAWTVMLQKTGIISRDTARQILEVIKEDTEDSGFGGEYWLKEKLGGDGDTAAAINIGRTLQEPMARLQLRDRLLDVIDALQRLMKDVLDRASENTGTLFQGQSHLSAAQPTTYAAYLLAVYDGLWRGLDMLEVAYSHTNRSSAGCGACSGTGWPTDRQMVSDLLGFDGLVEPVYDCEASQDEMLSISFAVTHIGVLLSRVALDFEMWSTHDLGMCDLEPKWRGVSSFMPQKSHTGTFEQVRTKTAMIVGSMMGLVTAYKGEPFQDVLPILDSSPRFAIPATCQAESQLEFFRHLLNAFHPNPARMKENMLNQFSGAPEIQRHLVLECGYGLRRAHKVVATMVRNARARGIKPAALTGEMLDEAATMVEEPVPGVATDDVRRLMTLEGFFETHCGIGDPCPSESERLIDGRRNKLRRLADQQDRRKQQIRDARRRLKAEMDAILNGSLEE